MTDLRIGMGYDVHALVEGRPLILGGVTIPCNYGLDGHSDADVLIHALMDALLGSLALGDIGHLFPDTSDEFKGIDSRILLKRVIDIINDKHYVLVNTDITVIAQKPKLAPYINEMRMNLSKDLNVDMERISVKATTTEHLGFEGRGEGIAAEAIVLVEKE